MTVNVDTHTEDDDLDVNTNTDTDEVVNRTEETEEIVETSSDTGEETEDTQEEEKPLTPEQLDALSDEEFEELMESGKRPSRVIKAPEAPKVASKEDKGTEALKTTPEGTSKEAPAEVLDEAALRKIHADIFAPFKANGKKITPKSVEDVIALMQRGANYTKRMQQIAPMRKAVESLNKADIKEDDLNFLIDVHRGNKEAIKKLLEKHKVDPLELDMEATNYVPTNNIASDADVEYASTLEEVQASIPKIREIIGSTWDSKSKELILQDPRLLKGLHEEIQAGRFDKVQTKLEEERTFGRYEGKSDLEAYIDIVTAMVAEEANSAKMKASATPVRPAKPVPDKTKAAPVRAKAGNQGTSLTAKDIFSMPDEEFDRLNLSDLA